MLFRSRSDDLCFGLIRQTGKPHQDDPERNAPKAIDKFAEIFVARDEQRLPLIRFFQNLVINNARSGLSNRKNFVPILAETVNDWSIDTLIGDQLHATFSASG